MLFVLVIKQVFLSFFINKIKREREVRIKHFEAPTKQNPPFFQVGILGSPSSTAYSFKIIGSPTFWPHLPTGLPLV